MLTLLQNPIDMHPTQASPVCPHQSLNFYTPSCYHSYAPEAPSRYASNAATPPCGSKPQPNPLHHLPFLHSHSPLPAHPSLRFQAPTSSYLPLTMLTILQCPLMIAINHPCTCTMFDFCPNSRSFAQFTILMLTYT
ncbi:hypothetical protein O181_067593 [Austropuccinia psidii MF-1]|uniref:Uncharacterized protein n=1 Tax=Austropuccinia psidii MF-1 TaxID=1389203 RepID=A0A9Q3EZ23_9BASI|nr:hypothetical protein [Austropuccinia psidii MF-1]